MRKKRLHRLRFMSLQATPLRPLSVPPRMTTTATRRTLTPSTAAASRRRKRTAGCAGSRRSIGHAPSSSIVAKGKPKRLHLHNRAAVNSCRMGTSCLSHSVDSRNCVCQSVSPFVHQSPVQAQRVDFKASIGIPSFINMYLKLAQTTPLFLPVPLRTRRCTEALRDAVLS